LSDQETKNDPETNSEEEVENPEGATEESQSQRTEDPIGDLSELDKIKKELEAEKAEAASRCIRHNATGSTLSHSRGTAPS